MAETARMSGLSAERKVARRYRALGYEVQEHPGPDALPAFMQGAQPGIVARSAADNVVVEVKTRASLKGANDLVEIAERVAEHPGWRFELVVVEPEDAALAEADEERLRRKVAAAAAAGLPDLAQVTLTHALVIILRDLARRHGMKARDRADRSLVPELSFRGVLPEALAGDCLAAFDRRDALLHAMDDGDAPDEAELERLLRLCGQVRALA